jgi:hypothetical protein
LPPRSAAPAERKLQLMIWNDQSIVHEDHHAIWPRARRTGKVGIPIETPRHVVGILAAI